MHKLTSRPKLLLSEMLENPMSPEYIAEKLGITRQAVDKHIKEMQSYGVLEKIWVTSGKRPRVEFKLSPTGTYFYKSLTGFIDDYKKCGIEDYENQLKAIDLKFISGSISQPAYFEMRKELDDAMNWFLKNPGKYEKK
jgi:Predicted transcriptional regulator